MHEQGTLTVGSVISHTELALASTKAAAAATAIDELFSLLLLLLPDDEPDEDEDVGVEDAFEEGSVLTVVPPPPELSPNGDCCGGGIVGAACIMQSCQTRSGSRTAGELLMSVDDMLYWLPRSFEGDSGTVSGGFMSGLLLMSGWDDCCLLLFVVRSLLGAPRALDTAAVREAVG